MEMEEEGRGRLLFTHSLSSQSTHRAKLGDILYLVFLPPEARHHDDPSGGDRSHLVYTNLLLASAAAQVDA